MPTCGGHDTFTNPEFIFVLGTQASNTFEQYNYPVGVENGNSGNCPTQALVDAYEYQFDGKTFKEKHPGDVDVTAEIHTMASTRVSHSL